MIKKISFITKILIFVTALIGVLFACIYARADGYSHWTKRLLYFTNQSNLWIGIICLLTTVVNAKDKVKSEIKRLTYVTKFIFTVSITLTGLIFWVLLAPFADQENYNVWTVASILTHIVVPVLAVFDFFYDDYKIILTKKHTLLAIIPPLIYFTFASILSVCQVDFGRGENFPYFFMDFYSEAGLLGFVSGDLPQLGTVYWLVLILLIILGIGFLYRVLNNNRIKKIK